MAGAFSIIPLQAHWTDADYSKLARAMQKFPAGTALRWEKIGQQLNHPPADILARAKDLKSKQFAATTDTETVLPGRLEIQYYNIFKVNGIFESIRGSNV